VIRLRIPMPGDPTPRDRAWPFAAVPVAALAVYNFDATAALGSAVVALVTAARSEITLATRAMLLGLAALVVGDAAWGWASAAWLFVFGLAHGIVAILRSDEQRALLVQMARGERT
jgi:hypothetical protein